jgi:acetylornithine deacetylase/succinyl-diaminopimelate desuccinylase-like protein
MNRSLLLLFGLYGAVAQASGSMDPHALARDIFKQLVEINTSESGEGTTPAAQAMAQRLRDAGFSDQDIDIVGDNRRKQNLVARLHGIGKRGPILLMGHLDVVEARREEWSTDPYRFIEKDGFFYGRGTQDMKDGDAILVATIIRLHQEHYRGDRDIILALTADEEGGDSNGVQWLLKHRPELTQAEFALNHDGTGVVLQNGKPITLEISASEKVYADFDVSVTNEGGHSSVPRADNAIYSLARALDRIAAFAFPFELNTVTRAYYESMLKTVSAGRREAVRGILKSPPDPDAIARLSEDPVDNASVRTTCVATRLQGGHGNNALPQTARAIVNCRILPGHSPEETRQTLVDVVSDPEVAVRYVDVSGQLRQTGPQERGFEPPPLRRDVMDALEHVAPKYFPGIQVVPTMSVGASDAVFASASGIPTYFVSGEAVERSDDRMHGRDERIPTRSFDRAVDFYYEFLQDVLKRRN